ncbi:hypothetical protein SAZ10_00535 [Mesorhizobium sp. BAC0120]|uniref:phage adaptor protein n=1 Tax=Mesorhizobium sp. BAC0120 TaxID=3090670 RepID=UPI00298CA950|nr:hypothetical protein [Mesorhizobium sp. BAC0120]MDW6020242.1 hypothetical protein [Mesorhizobium sp. BAC0120]
MPIGNYDDLKSAVTNWMARVDVAGNAADFIMLAEARLNRELDPIELDAMIAGTTGSREIDIVSLSCDRPISLFLAQAGLNEAEMTPKAPGTFPLTAVAGRPRYWAKDGDKIGFDRALDADYPFRFRFSQKFALSDEAPVNWLLANHPDVYLAAVLTWGGLFIRDDVYAGQFQAVLNASLPEVKNIIAQSKRGLLTVEPMLQRLGQAQRGTYNAGMVEWP